MIFNPMIAQILKSPLHGLLSGSTMLTVYRGRKSGHLYETPVNYFRVPGENRLLTVSQRKRTWWRNLAGGQSVALRLRGVETAAHSRVILDEGEVAGWLAVYFQAAPAQARMLGAHLNAQGCPDPQDVARLARERVIVLFDLSGREP